MFTFIRSNKKKLLSVFMCVALMSIMAVSAFATTETTSLDGMINGVKGTLQNSFSVANLITIITAALGVTVTFALLWFAYRFIVRKVSGAMKKGRV